MNTTITFAGNLVDDPELRFTTGGKPVLECSVAVNRRVQSGGGGEGEWVDAEPTFWPVKVWGKPAENLAESVQRGNRVLVHGTVETEAWTRQVEGKESGEKRTRDVVVVSERSGEIAVSTKYAIARPEKTTSQTGSQTSS